MIKLIILDVDGVVKGFKEGINSPYPSKRVTDYIKQIQDTGVPISLCTGKASFAMRKIIDMMGLDNQHITDGGAVIFDAIDKVVLKSLAVPQNIIPELIMKTKDKKTLWELYTLEKKYVEAGLFPESLQENKETMPWEEVDNLIRIAQTQKIIKVEVKYPPELDVYYKELFKPYEALINIQWTLVPVLLPNKIFIITAKGVDKKKAVLELIKYYNILPEEVLAVGDTKMDWLFMEGCGYVATMENADEEMKGLVKSRNGFIGGHVDNDGLIDIIEHYKGEIAF